MALFFCSVIGKMTREHEASTGRSMLMHVLPSYNSLRQLGEFYGTDKTHTGFVDVYQAALPHGNERVHVQFVVEIGVFFGASLKMWRDYYPHATIIGIDAFKGVEGYKFNGKNQKFSQPRAFLDSLREGKQGERIDVIEADESDDNAMVDAAHKLRGILHMRAARNEAEPIDEASRVWLDIAIDDGSHLQRNQQANLGRLFPLVRPGGYYVIEDMHCSFIPGYDTAPYPSPDTTFALLERFNQTGRIQGSFKQALSQHEARYIEQWSEPPVCYVPANKTRDRAFTCILRKRMSPGVVSPQ
mmetsp:Transcript_22791/g.49205  ORF Transcript_22791/g.49205 Transcript_22791/m.49205 type:complete len:300 (-) Transcript_22791:288-1187(-)|eukprot:CAMPEP_0183360194 /NCGR_PEP_ID=MMETSP0164_2-20130417/54562_1 /TAXON_ID=221442 /ORGANISM="Coccolithus pelagicus ssp braarudi, Strain PLY182g" /LENGTH=299 /DNA_ID=CAMNT_0025534495 /DNA_START=39 /DNA_END=938 /DNA_ORIENTATION=+